MSTSATAAPAHDRWFSPFRLFSSLWGTPADEAKTAHAEPEVWEGNVSKPSLPTDVPEDMHHTLFSNSLSAECVRQSEGEPLVSSNVAPKEEAKPVEAPKENLKPEAAAAVTVPPVARHSPSAFVGNDLPEASDVRDLLRYLDPDDWSRFSVVSGAHRRNIKFTVQKINDEP